MFTKYYCLIHFKFNYTIRLDRHLIKNIARNLLLMLINETFKRYIISQNTIWTGHYYYHYNLYYQAK